jgi:hypothetical protein
MSRGKDLNMASEIQGNFDGDQNVRWNEKPL